MNEVGAVLFTGLLGAALALYAVISQRAITRRQQTLQHFAKIDTDKDMIEARKEFIRLAKEPGGLAQWAEADKEGTKEADAIRLILNDFELSAVGMQFGIIDLGFYKRYSRSTVLRYWNHAAPFIYAIRARSGVYSIYHEFEELARWFQDGKARMPRRTNFWRLWF